MRSPIAARIAAPIAAPIATPIAARVAAPIAAPIAARIAARVAAPIVVLIVVALRPIAAADPASTQRTGHASLVAEQARRPAGPLISAVLSAAYAAAGLDRDPGRGWVQRTRLAGLIPWLTVRTTRDTSWQDAHAEVGHGTSLEFRATWRLDRLLFDGRELQVATIEAARRRERTRLAAHVIRAYYAWRRAAATRGDDDRGTARGDDTARVVDDTARVIDDTGRVVDERTTTRLDESVAELDALTDGWFSEQLARPPP